MRKQVGKPQENNGKTSETRRKKKSPLARAITNKMRGQAPAPPFARLSTLDFSPLKFRSHKEPPQHLPLTADYRPQNLITARLSLSFWTSRQPPRPTHVFPYPWGYLSDNNRGGNRFTHFPQNLAKLISRFGLSRDVRPRS